MIVLAIYRKVYMLTKFLQKQHRKEINRNIFHENCSTFILVFLRLCLKTNEALSQDNKPHKTFVAGSFMNTQCLFQSYISWLSCACCNNVIVILRFWLKYILKYLLEIFYIIIIFKYGQQDLLKFIKKVHNLSLPYLLLFIQNLGSMERF